MNSGLTGEDAALPYPCVLPGSLGGESLNTPASGHCLSRFSHCQRAAALPARLRPSANPPVIRV
ncbi:hypothetical protein [Dentiradicibacter hellwigii]|uniref:Uncharacterized protein n=1 Tax=Dentiradicibacter hellwigii TaxID=3149053 RepID=A0ABV4UFU5_9RHOO